MLLADAFQQLRWRLFLDLDGVLADFEGGVTLRTGEALSSFSSPRSLWGRLAATPNFFEELPWMPDGALLWATTRSLSPTILTGLPRGNWAAPQKRRWCARELGEAIPVLTCMSRDKAQVAARYLNPGERPLLIDDREAAQQPWERAGGIFILHRSAEESIRSLYDKIAYECPDFIPPS